MSREPTVQERIAAALILHDHAEQNSLTRPEDPLVMLREDPKFFVCAAALSRADAVLRALPEHGDTQQELTALRQQLDQVRANVKHWARTTYLGLSEHARLDAILDAPARPVEHDETEA
jgi:hypothetical protein